MQWARVSLPVSCEKMKSVPSLVKVLGFFFSILFIHWLAFLKNSYRYQLSNVYLHQTDFVLTRTCLCMARIRKVSLVLQSFHQDI